MASNKWSRPVATFRHPVAVEVFQPQFTLSPSLRFLDVAALSNAASAEVAIGEVDGGCCQHAVYATIRKGMVIGLRARPCPESERTKLSREHANVVAQAMKRVTAKRRSGHKLPMPVATFFGSRAVAQAVSVDVLVCVRICIFGICFTCCRVTTNPDPNAPVFCGRVTIDTTKTG